MSSSGDEEDFMSADEEGFDEETEISTTKSALKPAEESKTRTNKEEPKKEDNLNVSQNKEEDKLDESSKNRSENTKVEDDTTNKNNSTSMANDDDDDDQEALAERIRERNLRIARKFSVELAKSVKSSAPIPVAVHAPPDDVKSEEADNSINQPGTTKSNLPPAPPPTPALSSSSNFEDQNISITPSTQFAWRVPASKLNRAERSSSIIKEDQPKIALDRLSETLSHTDKSIFERVAEDLKKVAIKTTTDSSPSVVSSSLQKGEGSLADPALTAITSITDTVNTLGGWGWTGATKLFNSATQVTSQVGSVLDSVVYAGVGGHEQQQTIERNQPTRSAPRTSSDDNEEGTSSSRDEETNSEARHSRNPIEVIANEPIVDFTLSTMESLGKKAFEVVTERDDSGSLQIKGLGRPWERLGLTKASYDDEVDQSVSYKSEPDSGMRMRSKKRD